MKIFIDADGCPVVDITVRIAKEKSIECFIICDTAHEFSKDGAKTVVVEKGAENLDPSVIAAYVYETAKAFSKFYQTCSIVNAGEAKLAGARLYLAECTLQVIKNAMNLVLVPYLEKM